MESVDVIKWDCEEFAFSKSKVEYLGKIMDEHSLLKARFNLHDSLDDVFHQMVVCLDSKLPRQIHCHHNKDESFHLIDGKALLTIYNQKHEIIAKKELSMDGNIIARIEAGVWHSIEALSKRVVFHEVTTGPFDRSQTTFLE